MLGMLESRHVLAVVAAAAFLVCLVMMLRRKPKRTKLLPESSFVVTTDNSFVRVIDPSGQEWHATWSFVERLLIRTTDAGPLLPDVFCEIQPMEEPSFAFPGGATGEAEFLRQAEAHLPDFRNDQVIAAMSSTSNREFVVWECGRHCPRCQHEIPHLPVLTHADRLELRRIIDSSGSINA